MVLRKQNILLLTVNIADVAMYSTYSPFLVCFFHFSEIFTSSAYICMILAAELENITVMVKDY